MGNVGSLVLSEKKSHPMYSYDSFKDAPWIYIAHSTEYANVDIENRTELQKTIAARSDVDILFTGEWSWSQYRMGDIPPLRSEKKVNLYMDHWSAGRSDFLGTFPATCQGTVMHLQLDLSREYPAINEYLFIADRIKVMTGKTNVKAMPMLLVVEVESMESENLQAFSKEICEHVKDRTNFRMIPHLKNDMNTVYGGYEWLMETIWEKTSNSL